MFSLDEFAKRLTLERKRLGFTQIDLAEKLNMHHVTQNNYEAGKRAPDVVYLAKLEELHFDVNFLMQFTIASNKITNSVVMIPRYDVHASAGRGATVLDEEPLGYMAFQRDWIERMGLVSSSLFVIGVVGDSMTPSLQDHDSILVDRNINDIHSGAAYVFRQDDELLVKYLQKMPGNMLRVSSENQNYPSYDIDMERHADNVQIIGRVACSMHSWL